MKLSLEKILTKKKISIYRLAKDLKLSYKTTHNIVRGNTNTIKIDILGKICKILEVDVSEVFKKK